MSFDYVNSAATATRLLLRFGAVATLTRVTTGAYNPSTGTQATTEADFSTVAVVIDYPQKYIDGTLIKEGDRQAYLDPGVAVEQGDKLTWQGTEYTVVRVKELSPAGVTVLWEAQIRG